jgi:hypothetical protein
MLLKDSAFGFQLLMPANWRNLRPGDPLWAQLGSSDMYESQVADGTIQDYAVPVVPRDADPMVNLAVYVRSRSSSETLEDLADVYVKTLQDYKYPLIARDNVGLTAGPSVRLTATRPAGSLGTTADSRLLVYVLASPSRAYYVILISRSDTSTAYFNSFQCMAQSMVITK